MCVQRIRESEAELAQPQYADIVLEYRRKEVELRTLEMGNKDFLQYCKGLEKALLSYHGKKMESINQARLRSTLPHLQQHRLCRSGTSQCIACVVTPA